MKYWFLALPCLGTKEESWRIVNEKTTLEHDYATNYKLDVPDLKVGTLDTLMSGSESLHKLDQFCENLVHRMVQHLSMLLEKGLDELYTKLPVNGVALENFIPFFQWDEAKYPTRLSIKELHDSIEHQVTQIDTDLKNKMTTYLTCKGQLASLERKQVGNLMVRNLSDVIRKEDLLLDSEYLQTLLVIVPRHLYKEWDNSYETVTSMVVPRSSRLITEDDEYGLFSVVVFRKIAQDFKNLAKEFRFIVRDFEFNEQELEAAKRECQFVEAELKKQWTFLIRWCRAYFSELFFGWMHVKAMRLFVESVLRYGLPPKFQALIMMPHKKTEKRLHELLKQWETSGFVTKSISRGLRKESEDSSETYSFVFLPMELAAR